MATVSSNSSHLSRDFFNLVKLIGESRSKSEEDRIMRSEIETLKRHMAQPDIPLRKMRECLVRMLYAEMLGYDASFAHIYAVKMLHSKNLQTKRVAYLAVSIVLHPEHTFMLLIVNTLQNDLKSDNFMEVAMALTAVCKLLNNETIHVLLPNIAQLLEHREGYVRKKAVLALQRCNQIEQGCLEYTQKQIRKVLCDAHVSVMVATLHLLFDLAKHDVNPYKDLVPDIVSILKQVIDHRLPRDYDYHRMPAPWVQMKLLQLLALLGKADRRASEGMYTVLTETMRKADTGSNAGYAILYECICTVIEIYHDDNLIELAAQSVSRMLTSDSQNLRYLGVTALTNIVAIDSKYAADHQMVVIDCLEDQDETLRRKTLNLLYNMTNPVNVSVIIAKLIDFLKNTTDQFLCAELVTKICELAQKFSSDNIWYLNNMTTVFEIGANHVQPEIIEKVIKVIRDSCPGGLNETGGDIRAGAVEMFLDLLKKPSLPAALLRLIVWTLGEYGENSRVSEIVEQIITLINRQTVISDSVTTAWCLTALLKTVSRLPSIPANVVEVANRLQSSRSLDVQQRAHELTGCAQHSNILKSLFAEKPNQIDEKLTFLDNFVQRALDNGAHPYNPPPDILRARTIFKENESIGSSASPLKFTPYEAPPKIQVPQLLPHSTSILSESQTASMSAPAGAIAADTTNNTVSGLKLQGVQRKWGPSGYVDDHSAHHATAHPPPLPPIPNTPLEFTKVAGGVSRAAPSPTTATEITKPRHLTEKERLANSLFAGVGVTKVNSPVQKRSAGTYKSPSSSSSSAAASTTIDLLSFPPENITNSSQSSANAHSELTSFDSLFGDGGDTSLSSQTTPTGKSMPKSSTNQDVLSALLSSLEPVQPERDSTRLLNGSKQESAADSKTIASAPLFRSHESDSRPLHSKMQIQPAATTDPFGMLFSSLQRSNDNPVSSQQVHTANKLSVPDVLNLTDVQSISPPALYGAAAQSSTISLQLSALEKSPEIVALNHSLVHVSYLKATASDSTVIAVFFSNKLLDAACSLTVHSAVSDGLQLQSGGDPFISITAPEPHSFTATFTLSAGSTCTLLHFVRVADVSALRSSLHVQLTIVLNGQSNVVFVPFMVIDFLRPAPMQTDQYGSLWKHHSSEYRMSLRSSLLCSSSTFATEIATFHFYPVHSIGFEHIASAIVIGISTSPVLYVLVHGKCSSASDRVDLLIRSRSSSLSHLIGHFFQHEKLISK